MTTTDILKAIDAHIKHAEEQNDTFDALIAPSMGYDWAIGALSEVRALIVWKHEADKNKI